MKLPSAVVATLRSRRFWVWQLGGALIYAIPVAIRYATGKVEIPVLNFPGFWIWHIIPGNMLEKVLVNAFFPGGAGAVAAEILLSNYRGEEISRRARYLARLEGALGETAVWSLFQFWGFSLLIAGPHGGGNLFESVWVFPINFVLATFSVFTPDVLSLAKRGIERIRKKNADRNG
jgi:hypothetical protein